jgi:hypothetical protein
MSSSIWDPFTQSYRVYPSVKDGATAESILRSTDVGITYFFSPQVDFLSTDADSNAKYKCSFSAADTWPIAYSREKNGRTEFVNPQRSLFAYMSGLSRHMRSWKITDSQADIGFEEDSGFTDDERRVLEQCCERETPTPDEGESQIIFEALKRRMDAFNADSSIWLGSEGFPVEPDAQSSNEAAVRKAASNQDITIRIVSRAEMMSMRETLRDSLGPRKV